MPQDNNLVTIKDVIELYGNKITYAQVMYAIYTRKIKADKIGWQWLIHKDSLPDKWPKYGDR